MNKTCIRCNITKSVTEFYIRPNGNPHTYCKECHRANTRTWNANNKDKIRAYNRRKIRLKRPSATPVLKTNKLDMTSPDWANCNISGPYTSLIIHLLGTTEF